MKEFGGRICTCTRFVLRFRVCHKTRNLCAILFFLRATRFGGAYVFFARTQRSHMNTLYLIAHVSNVSGWRSLKTHTRAQIYTDAVKFIITVAKVSPAGIELVEAQPFYLHHTGGLSTSFIAEMRNPSTLINSKFAWKRVKARLIKQGQEWRNHWLNTPVLKPFKKKRGEARKDPGMVPLYKRWEAAFVGGGPWNVNPLLLPTMVSDKYVKSGSPGGIVRVGVA